MLLTSCARPLGPANPVLITTIRDLDNLGQDVVTPDYDDLRPMQSLILSDEQAARKTAPLKK
jgi:hypothetical protein